jgi:hypothetical protein
MWRRARTARPLSLCKRRPRGKAKHERFVRATAPAFGCIVASLQIGAVSAPLVMGRQTRARFHCAAPSSTAVPPPYHSSRIHRHDWKQSIIPNLIEDAVFMYILINNIHEFTIESQFLSALGAAQACPHLGWSPELSTGTQTCPPAVCCALT